MSLSKILLIDDSVDMTVICEQVFESAKYSLVSARFGHEGLKLMVKSKPNLIMLDYLLPDMKGSEVLNRIACETKYSEFRRTPVIMLTAWEQGPDELKTLYQKGLSAYLSKPFGPRELKAVVDSFIAAQIFRANDAKVSKDLPAAEIESHHGASSEIHDLVASIVGVSRSLLGNLDMELSVQDRTYLSAIHHCGRKLLKLLD